MVGARQSRAVEFVYAIWLFEILGWAGLYCISKRGWDCSMVLAWFDKVEQLKWYVRVGCLL